jgi:hypothetical protein
MKSSRASYVQQAALILCAASLAIAALTATASSQTGDAATIAQIDTECNAIQNAIMALHPIHVAYKSGTWVVLSDADYAVVAQTGASITLADVYKQGSKYAWVQAHSFAASGKQRATQLCFRQSDGTLERARQATTAPELAAASAQQAYYSSNGTVLQATSLFEVNDPMLAKKIEALPFYSVLPQ